MDVSLADLLERGQEESRTRSTVFASRVDQRCSYSFSSPTTLRPGATFRNMLVYIHGEGRRFQYLMQNLEALGAECNYLIVCPLFPANLFRDGNVEGYKYLEEQGLRYDHIVLDLIEELRATYVFEDDRFLLGGFSGGGQFCNRFCFQYPELLRAVSLAAPGSVTLLDPTLPWWPGIGATPEMFDRDVDIEALKSVALHLVVGTRDVDERGVRFGPSNRYWSPQANVAGGNRVERLLKLDGSLRAAGILARLELAPDTGHVFRDLQPYVEDFFRDFASAPAASADAPADPAASGDAPTGPS
jgi:poly(3-hydroxybutyrate) depolymerase